MLPFKNLLKLDPDCKFPIYIKIVNAFVELISNGTLASGVRIPSTRNMAVILKVHRKTVVAAYEELVTQGWVVPNGRKGSFINSELPIINPKHLGEIRNEKISADYQPNILKNIYTLDGGTPDTRLTLTTELGRNFSSLMRKNNFIKDMDFGRSEYGDQVLRNELVFFLRDTRGIHICTDQILITRGSTMGFYLMISNYISEGDKVVVGYPGYYFAFDTAVNRNGGEILQIPVDDQGLNIAALEILCKRERIKMVMVIPHHHYPTTVTLSANRRLRLLELARKYNFLIFEDDWDYDFHYRNNPILPLASIDNFEHVIYAGSFSKIISSGIRVGYIIANKTRLAKMAELRRIIDRAGDVVLERAISELLKFGDIERNIRKVKKVYEHRRNYMYEILVRDFKEYFEFHLPEGGMGIWLKYKDEEIGKRVEANAIKQGIYMRSILKEGLIIGFASVNEKEIDERMEVLRKLLKLSSNNL